MASSNLVGSNVTLKYQTGVNSKGDDVFDTTRISNINMTAKDEDLVTLADKVDALMDHEISEIKKEQIYIVSRV